MGTVTVTVTETTGVDTVTGVGGIAGAVGTEGTSSVTGFVAELTVETAASGPEAGLETAPAGAEAEAVLPEEPLLDGWSLAGALRSAPCVETAERRWRRAAALTARLPAPEAGR